nr:transmembrane protein 14A isoform X2 [Desmodus rotundus]
MTQTLKNVPNVTQLVSGGIRCEARHTLWSVSNLQKDTLPMDLVGFGYAALVTFGSIWGYKRRGGVPSLIAGLSVGLLAGYGAYRVSNNRRDVKVSLSS